MLDGGFGPEDQGGEQDGGGFDAQHMGTEIDGLRPGTMCGLELILGPAAFGADEGDDMAWTLGNVIPPGGIGDDQANALLRQDDSAERGERRDLHRPGTEGLFGGLAADALHAVNFV